MVDANRAPGYFTSIYKAGLGAGLYTQASPLSVPEGYSPAMENVFFNRRNNVRTRFGTQELLNALDVTSYLYIFRTKFDVTLVLAKEGKDLNVYRITEVQSQELDIEVIRQFNDVWSDEAADSIPDFTFVSSDRPRAIIATGTNTLVQVRLTERQITNRTPSAVLIIQDAEEFTDITDQALVFRNGVLLPSSDYTFTGDQIVLDSALTGVFDILYVSWQWFTESSGFFGFQLSQTVSRFNTGPSDLSLPIPPELIVGIRPVVNNPTRLPIAAYKNGLQASALAYLNPPTLENEFTYSGGSYRTTANTEKILPGITHLTFGVVNPDETDISELTIIRVISLQSYNGGMALPGTYLSVFVDDVASIFDLNAVNAEYGTYYNLVDSVASFVADETEPTTYVSFTATESVGLRYGAIARVVRSNPAPVGSNYKFIGTSALDDVNELPYNRSTIGAWWPAYGLQEHADFINGSFPSHVELHENRLVLSGFLGSPNRIVLSSVLDSTFPDDYYADFQIREQEGLDVNAVVLDINTIDAGGITAIRSASGTLFAFTLNSVYLIAGGEGGLTPTSKFVTQVAGVGAVNSNCVLVINNAVLFLSRSGIYTLTQSFDAAGGWRVQPISEAINDRVVNPFNASVAWMSFLPNEDTLYVCVASEGSLVADELYLWKQDTNAWSKFTDYTGSWKSSSGKFADLKQNYLLMSKQGRLISYPYRLPIDQFTGTPAPITFSEFAVREVQTVPFILIPDVGIQDIGVVGDITATKLNESQIFIDSNDPANSYVYPKGVNNDLVVVYTDDGVRKSSVTYDIETGLVGTIDPTDIRGFIYRCYAATPNLFVSSDKSPSYLPSNKTVHTCYFVFHTNGEYPQFGVGIKKVDVDPVQLTPLNKFPAVDSSLVAAFDAAVLDAARQLVRPFWKVAIHPGGIEDFYQMIVVSDSVNTWELISLQTTVTQSSVRPGTGRI